MLIFFCSPLIDHIWYMRHMMLWEINLMGKDGEDFLLLLDLGLTTSFGFVFLLVLAASVPMPSYPSSGSGSSSSSSSTSHLTSPPVSTAQGMHCLCWWSPCLCVWNEISAFTLSWWKSLNTHFGWAWCSVLSSLEFGSWRLAYSPQDIFISVCHCLLDEKSLWKKLYEWH